MTPDREFTFYAALGHRLREARRSLGLTQGQLGERMNVTAKSVSQWESATHRMSLFTYERLARILGAFR